MQGLWEYLRMQATKSLRKTKNCQSVPVVYVEGWVGGSCLRHSFSPV